MSKYKILTNDPSFTAWGFAVLNEHGNVIETGCIKTAPENKKRRIRKGDDTVRRVQEINRHLLSVIKHHNINYILSELPHGSQNAAAAVMIGICIGIIQTLADSLDVGVEWYSEQDSKKCVLGKKAATKHDMIEAIDNLYMVKWKNVKYSDEAVADALAVHYVASKQSPILKLIKR